MTKVASVSYENIRLLNKILAMQSNKMYIRLPEYQAYLRVKSFSISTTPGMIVVNVVGYDPSSIEVVEVDIRKKLDLFLL